jgi:putative ABC transport system permease protein
METFIKDVKYAIRGLIKQPGFTAVAVLTLALGLGANTAIFSFVSGVLLRPLPFPASDRLIVLSERNPEKNIAPVVSPRNLEDWQRQSTAIEEFGAWRDWHFRLTTSEGTTGTASAICSPGLFRVLGITPLRGRLFTDAENQVGQDHVIMISSSYWQNQFASDEKVIGQTLMLDKQPFTIIGVLPPSLEALDLGSWDIWAPLTVDPDQFLGRAVRNRRLYARLKPGVSPAQAEAEMKTIAARLQQQYPEANTGWTVALTTLHENEVGDLREPLLLFMFTVGLVLLIACINVAMLMLARAESRRKEFALRVALGAGRFQLLRQLITESALLSLAGGAVGLLLAVWLIDLFVAILPRSMPQAEHVKLSGPVLIFTLGLSLVTGILFGLAPGLQSSRVNLVQELKEGHGLFRQRGGQRLRAALVISQVALALVLLVMAGLLGQTFIRLIALKPGYDPQNVLTAQVFVPIDKYKGRARIAALYEQITDGLKTIPGVISVGATTSGPHFGGSESIDLQAEGATPPPSGVYPQAAYFNTGPNYFHTMAIPVVEGRDFTGHDDAAAPPVAIINQTLARRLWPGEHAAGKRLIDIREREVLEVIGVAGDVKRFGLGEEVRPEVYFPYSQRPRWAMFFMLRTGLDSAAVAAALKPRVSSIDPELSVSGISTMDQRIGRALKRPRFNLVLLGIFAGTALMLAGIGVYGVMSFLVVRQTKEIGIRTALGAKSRDIFKLVIGRGMILALAGIVIGAGSALAATRLLTGLLYGVTGADPLTFIAVAIVLAFVVLCACYFPARRALRVDPLIALRSE